MGSSYLERLGVVLCSAACYLYRLLVGIDSGARGVLQSERYVHLPGLLPGVHDPCLHLSGGLGPCHIGRRDMQAVHAVCLGAEVDVLHLEQERGVVQPVVLVEVGGHRYHLRIQCIVGAYGYLVVALSRHASEVYDERGVAALVMAEHFAVHSYRRGLSCTLKEQVDGVLDILAAQRRTAAVVGFAAVVFGGVPVLSVAGVGQGDFLPVGAVFTEFPCFQFGLLISRPLRVRIIYKECARGENDGFESLCVH